MSSLPGLRYQPHSRGNKPFVIFKDTSKKPRLFYLPDNDRTSQYEYGPTYKKNKAFSRKERLYQEQTVTVVIKDEDDDENSETIRHEIKFDVDDKKPSDEPRIVTTIGLWSKGHRLFRRQTSEAEGSVISNVSKGSFTSHPNSASSRTSHVVFTRNNDDEPIHATVMKDPLEARLSIPDDEEEQDIDRSPGGNGTSVPLTDEDSFLSGSFIRTSDTNHTIVEPPREDQNVSSNAHLWKIERLLISEEEDFGIKFAGIEDQNARLFPSIYLSETKVGTENNIHLRKRTGRGPMLVNRQSGAYLDKSWDRYSDDNTYISDNNPTEGIHIYPAISVQEIVVKEKSHSHSFPTLTLHHAQNNNGVRLHPDVPQVQNSELLGPATALPLKRDSQDFSQELSKDNTQHNIDPEQPDRPEVTRSEEIETFENIADNEMLKDRRIEKTIVEDSNSEEASTGHGASQEEVQEFYHGNQGFQDSILTPPLPNSMHQDYTDMIRRKPSYIDGKCEKHLLRITRTPIFLSYKKKTFFFI